MRATGGPHVGFYGGVNYGYGYGGEGYQGGYWRGGRLYYNRSVNNVHNVHITNVYNKTVINNVTVNRVSYNGGNGGVRARPSAADNRAGRDRHIVDTPGQREHEQAARSNPVLRAAENKGHPPICGDAAARRIQRSRGWWPPSLAPQLSNAGNRRRIRGRGCSSKLRRQSRRQCQRRPQW